MAVSNITYADKSQAVASTFPTDQTFAFGNANEIKTVVNNNATETETNTTNISVNAAAILLLESVSSTSVVYVSNDGNDSKDGSLIGQPKLTISDAITQAITLLPTSLNQIAVEVLDSAQYNEDFELPSFVHLYADKATINGQVTVNDSCVVKARRFQNNIDDEKDLIKKTSGAGAALIEAKIFIVVGALQRGIQNNSGVISIITSVMAVDAGIGVNAKSGSEIAFNIQDWILTNNGQGVGTRASSSGSLMVGQIFRVIDDGTGLFIKTRDSGDRVNIQGGSIEVDTIYDLGATSVLNMFVNSMTGDKIADPTAIVNIDNNESLRSGEVIVKSLSDFPTPSAGVITLDVPNTVYIINGNVDIGTNRIVIAAIAVEIMGIFGSKDFLTSSTTGVMFSATNFNVFINEIRMTALSASKLFEFVGSGLENCQIKMCAGIAANLGTIDDYKTFGVRDCFFTGFSTGFVLNGVFDAMLFKINLAEGFTGVLLDLNGCTSDSIDVSENAVTLQTGGTFMEIAPNGANIILGGEGSIFGNKVNTIAGGTPIVGYTSFETEWGVILNDKIKTSDRGFPSGWGFYVDGGTSPATQVFDTTPSKIQIDGLGSGTDESHLPNSIRGISSLWDVTNDEILPVTDGDSFDLRINVTVTGKSGNPNSLILQLDIGGGATPTIIIARDDKTVTNSPPYALIYTFPIFTAASFLLNKGQLFLSTDTGSVTVSIRQILIIRTSSGAA